MSTPPHLPSQRLRSRRSPPELADDLIAEILLRLPPRKPERLIRCSAVCKSWRLLLTDPSFLRRYREFHGVAPMLGVLFNLNIPAARVHFVARFVPTTSFRPRTLEHGSCFVRDARHGRVLFCDFTSDDGNKLFVWNSVTDERWGLPLLVVPYWWGWGWNATVLCAAAVRQGGRSGECDHLNCHRGPFLVAFVGTNEDGTTCACVYSSETAGWSDPTYAEHPDGIAEFDRQPSTLVGNMVYFLAKDSMTIVENDCRRKLAFVDPPFEYHGRGVLMPAMGGGLGFAGVRESRYLWSRETGSGRTAAAWTQSRVLHFSTLPSHAHLKDPTTVAFAEGLGVIFLRTDFGVFMINLNRKSCRVRKFCCIRDVRAVCTDRLQRELRSAFTVNRAAAEHRITHPIIELQASNAKPGSFQYPLYRFTPAHVQLEEVEKTESGVCKWPGEEK